MRKILALLLVLLASPAFSDTLPANPSLWHVRGPKGDAFIFGSVHVLPPDVQWRTPKIAAAMQASDVFVFEVPQDDAATEMLQRLVAAKGFLPKGQTLRAQLPPDAREDFDAAVAQAGLPQPALDRTRPWLAALQILFAQLARHNYGAQDGVDSKVMAEAAGREQRYLETIEQQFALLAPQDTTLEMEEFRAILKDLRNAIAEIQPMVEAWRAGDQDALDALINGDLEQFPAARKALLDDRNQRWLGQIRVLLQEKHTYFITVGAGHLTGHRGVPALLRRAGLQVEGP